MVRNRNVSRNRKVNKGVKRNNVPPSKPAWNLWQALFLILLITLLEWALGWLATPENLDTPQGLLHFVSVGFGEGVIYLAVIFIFMKILRRPLSELGLVRPRLGYVFLGVIMGFVLFVGVGLLGTLLARWLGTPAPQSFAEAVNGASYTWEFVLLLTLGGLVAPLKEEILFRGLVYPPLRQAYGKGKGIIYTGLFFGALHWDMVRFLPLFIGGVILTWLYERSRSIWPAIIAHGTWNVLMALALWIQR